MTWGLYAEPGYWRVECVQRTYGPHQHQYDEYRVCDQSGACLATVHGGGGMGLPDDAVASLMAASLDLYNALQGLLAVVPDLESPEGITAEKALCAVRYDP